MKAAREELDTAIVFHEVWKPTAYDRKLHERVGRSYAAQAFKIVRTSLRREMLMALLRLWDTSPKAVRISRIASFILKPEVLKTLAKERAAKFEDFEVERQMRNELESLAKQIGELARKYSNDGPHFETLRKLRIFRNEHFAHRQVERSVDLSLSEMDREVEAFYLDSSKIVRLLLSVVSATAYDSNQTADVFGFYADNFWAGVCGEANEGHPNFRQNQPE